MKKFLIKSLLYLCIGVVILVIWWALPQVSVPTLPSLPSIDLESPLFWVLVASLAGILLLSKTAIGGAWPVQLMVNLGFLALLGYGALYLIYGPDANDKVRDLRVSTRNAIEWATGSQGYVYHDEEIIIGQGESKSFLASGTVTIINSGTHQCLEIKTGSDTVEQSVGPYLYHFLDRNTRMPVVIMNSSVGGVTTTLVITAGKIERITVRAKPRAECR